VQKGFFVPCAFYVANLRRTQPRVTKRKRGRESERKGGIEREVNTKEGRVGGATC